MGRRDVAGSGGGSQELVAQRVPFVLAKVVLAERPTSARPGDEALVLADGTMEGFVGGDCAEATVRAQALAVLDSGEPVVLRISADGRATAGGQGDGAQPLPQRRHVGDLPRTASPAAADGGRRRRPDRRGRCTRIGAAARLRGRRRPTGTRPISPRPSSSPRTAATRPTALSAALACRRRLRRARREPEARGGRRRARSTSPVDGPSAIVTPAGLDIGARTPEEVALSICADVIARRPRPAASGRHRRCRATAGDIAIDPVCGMTVAAVESSLHLDHDGRRYWFCGTGCLRAFAADPDRYSATLMEDHLVDSVAELRARPRRRRLRRRPRPGDRAVLRRPPAPAAARRGRGRRRQDGVGEGAGRRSLDTPLVRLQCYEGITAAEALYEWNYPRQLLAIRTAEAGWRARPRGRSLHAADFLIDRPLLRAIRHPGPRPAVLLIDEIDRADDEFEAFLFELLAESAVTIPELGTVRADAPAGRRPDVEPHPRPPRRPEAPLPLPLDRLPAVADGRRDRAPPRPGRPHARSSSRSVTPSAGCARSTCRSHRASPRRSPGSPPSRCSASRR